MFAWRSLWPGLREAGQSHQERPNTVAVSLFGLRDLLTPFEERCRIAGPGCTSACQLGTAGSAVDVVAG